MSFSRIFRTQPYATLLRPGHLLQSVLERLSEDEHHNIMHDAWLHVTRGQGDDWCCHIRIEGEDCVHQVNLLQPDHHVNAWAFEFNTETNQPEAWSDSGLADGGGGLGRQIA